MNVSESSGIPQRMIDTNIILRYLVGDGEDQAEKARDLFRCAADGKVILLIAEVVFIEAVHVLSRYYKTQPEHIAKALKGLIRLPGVETTTPVSVLTKALDDFVRIGVPWPDALIAAHAYESGISEVYSFDGHFDKFPGIKKLVP